MLLEPNDSPAAKTYQKAIYEQGNPATSFVTDDVERGYERLEALGVAFHAIPTNVGSARIAVFDDACGNLIQIAQVWWLVPG